MNRETKLDIIELTRAYIGTILITVSMCKGHLIG